MMTSQSKGSALEDGAPKHRSIAAAICSSSGMDIIELEEGLTIIFSGKFAPVCERVKRRVCLSLSGSLLSVCPKKKV